MHTHTPTDMRLKSSARGKIGGLESRGYNWRFLGASKGVRLNFFGASRGAVGSLGGGLGGFIRASRGVCSSRFWKNVRSPNQTRYGQDSVRVL